MSWPWKQFDDRARYWKLWWEDSKAAIGQTASEMFLWHLIGRYCDKVDALLIDEHALANLRIRARGNSELVLGSGVK